MQSTVMDDTANLVSVMAAGTPTPTRVSDEQAVFRFFNQAWAEFTGRSIADETGNGWLERVHPEDRSRVQAAYQDALRKGGAVNIQYRLRRYDGDYCWMLDAASPWKRADGSLGGWVSACTDVTALRQAGSSTGHHEAERLPTTFARVTRSGTVRFLCAVPAPMQPDQSAVCVQYSDLPDEMAAAVGGLLSPADDAAMSSREVEFSLAHEEREYRLIAAAVPLDAADPSGELLISFHDTTRCVTLDALHQASRQREEQAKQKAAGAARARDQFLSIVSHELRSPLNGIQSWTHVLESQIDTGRPIVQRALAGIKTGVTQQVTLIESLLDATQVLNGQVSLTPHAYSLNGAVQAAIDSVRSEAEQKEIDVSFTPEVADIDMEGDVERVQQIVRQLVSNAVKFTEERGDVHVSVSRQDGMAVVTVEDNGAGIAPEAGASLFEPFRQADSSQTRRAAGLGLGLAVSRRLAELHGGRLAYESEGIGHGSTFRVFLPLLA